MPSVQVQDAEQRYASLSIDTRAPVGHVYATADYYSDSTTVLLDYDAMVALRDFLTQQIKAQDEWEEWGNEQTTS